MDVFFGPGDGFGTTHGLDRRANGWFLAHVMVQVQGIALALMMVLAPTEWSWSKG